MNNYSKWNVIVPCALVALFAFIKAYQGIVLRNVSSQVGTLASGDHAFRYGMPWLLVGIAAIAVIYFFNRWWEDNE